MYDRIGQKFILFPPFIYDVMMRNTSDISGEKRPNDHFHKNEPVRSKEHRERQKQLTQHLAKNSLCNCLRVKGVQLAVHYLVELINLTSQGLS